MVSALRDRNYVFVSLHLFTFIMKVRTFCLKWLSAYIIIINTLQRKFVMKSLQGTEKNYVPSRVCVCLREYVCSALWVHFVPHGMRIIHVLVWGGTGISENGNRSPVACMWNENPRVDWEACWYANTGSMQVFETLVRTPLIYKLFFSMHKSNTGV